MRYTGLSAFTPCRVCKRLSLRTRWFMFKGGHVYQTKVLMSDLLIELEEHKRILPQDRIIDNRGIHFIYEHLDLLVGRLLFLKK